MNLIVGLGNPGKEYENTRHNIGFQILNELRKGLGLSEFKPEKKFKAEVSQNKNIILAKPQTFMNLSGEAVKLLKSFYKVKPQNIIVIHDDLDLPVGKIRISLGSSSGGHKGLESIIQNLKNKTFIRIRLGVANESRTKIPAEKFVLQKFSKQDEKDLRPAIAEAIEAVQMLTQGESLEKVQNKFN